MSKIDFSTIEVHPAAAVYPMIRGDELTQLAADINENGLLDPLVIKYESGNPILIDGRNRLAACLMVGVEPSYEVYEGEVIPFILSKNENRRHMTKGQRAMCVAKIVPEATRHKRGGSNITNCKNGIVGRDLSQARTILKWNPSAVENVIQGDTGLSVALKVANEAKLKAASRIERMRVLPDDYQSRVREEQLTLEEAEQLWRAEVESQRKDRLGIWGALNSLSRISELMQHDKEREAMREAIVEFSKREYDGNVQAVLEQTIEACQKLLRDINQ